MSNGNLNTGKPAEQNLSHTILCNLCSIPHSQASPDSVPGVNGFYFFVYTSLFDSVRSDTNKYLSVILAFINGTKQMKQIIAITVLWAIAYLSTVIIVGDSHLITLISPVFAICMIGSIMVVRRKKQ